MAESYAVIPDGGRLNVSSLGCKIIAECSSVMITILIIFLALYISHVSKFLCGGVFETASTKLRL